MSFWSSLAKIAGIAAPIAAAPFTGGASLATLGIGGAMKAAAPGLIGAAGSALSGAAASAENRNGKIEAAIEQERLNQSRQHLYAQDALAREASRLTSGSDALKKLQQTSYLIHKDSDYAPPTVNTGQGAKALPSFGFGPRASTETEITGAHRLRNEAMARLNHEDSLLPQIQNPGQFQIDPNLLKQSGWEKFMGAAGLGLSTYDIARQEIENAKKKNGGDI